MFTQLATPIPEPLSRFPGKETTGDILVPGTSKAKCPLELLPRGYVVYVGDMVLAWAASGTGSGLRHRFVYPEA